MEPISFAVAFGAGLLSFLSPCMLPLLPVYLASLAGPEILETGTKIKRLSVFLHSLTFVVGFSIVFTLWGVGAGLLGSVLIGYLGILRQVTGVLLILFGLLMLASLKVPWLSYSQRLNLSLGTRSGYLRSFLIGIILPVAWIPCTSWVLAGILMLAGASTTAGQGAYLLAVYSLGMGLPFLAIGLAFGFLSPFLRKVNRYAVWLYLISGLMLILVGILVLTNQIFWFQTLIPR
ncbi:MAG: cytochrome c biogenesis protein CcdA [bacterium]|nr:cytochrome c biogenesis protein CcdA [bacterium]